MLQTEYEFTLPYGYVDGEGTLHRHGVMRLCTALDEVAAMQDARVRLNQAYLSILLLARVVTRLGGINGAEPAVIEQLFSSDFAYLQDLFVRINDLAPRAFETACPSCGAQFALDLAGAEAGSA
jgi:hypothetical protein